MAVFTGSYNDHDAVIALFATAAPARSKVRNAIGEKKFQYGVSWGTKVLLQVTVQTRNVSICLGLQDLPPEGDGKQGANANVNSEGKAACSSSWQRVTAQLSELHPAISQCWPRLNAFSAVSSVPVGVSVGIYGTPTSAVSTALTRLQVRGVNCIINLYQVCFLGKDLFSVAFFLPGVDGKGIFWEMRLMCFIWLM